MFKSIFLIFIRRINYFKGPKTVQFPKPIAELSTYPSNTFYTVKVAKVEYWYLEMPIKWLFGCTLL